MPKTHVGRIRTAVIETIARHARRPKASITDEEELTGILLGFRDVDVGNLAMSLRGYVKAFNEDGGSPPDERYRSGVRTAGHPARSSRASMIRRTQPNGLQEE